jgi:hypothetical protein
MPPATGARPTTIPSSNVTPLKASAATAAAAGSLTPLRDPTGRSGTDDHVTQHDLERAAVNTFFQKYNSGRRSFWNKKNRNEITLEEIIRHAFGVNRTGFFGHSGANTKIALEKLGVDFTRLSTIRDMRYLVISARKTINHEYAQNNAVRARPIS